jgi:hypothetical protein
MNRLLPVAHLPLALAALLALLVSAPWDTAAASDRSKGAECAAIDDPSARLACFDAAFPRAPRASSPAPAVAIPAADKPTAPAPVVADIPAKEAVEFGLSEQQKAEREGKPPKPELAATTAAIRTARKLSTGYWLITLDNGQVWQQTELDPNVWLDAGDRVTIRKASLGSFLLVTPGSYSTRVRRLQ